MALAGKICLVTGASRGIGKGIAVMLGQAGATVYITGRSTSADAAVVGGSLKETEGEINARGGKCVAVTCDHSKDADIKSLFEKIEADHGRLDVLVNNAYSAVSFIKQELENGNKFWECDLEPGQAWDVVNTVGLRNNYICSTYAAKMMVKVRQGLIVNVSSFGGQRYVFNVPYGVGKAGVDRLTADIAVELKEYDIACVTLYPGAVKTEHFSNTNSDLPERVAKIFENGESPEYSGKAVVGLATDPNVRTKSGKIVMTAELAREYGFTDAGGVHRLSYRNLKFLVKSSGHPWIAAFIPEFLKSLYFGGHH